MTNEYGINYYWTAEDERYPTLVIRGEQGNVGYDLNRTTGKLSRVCICVAHSTNECVCGAWDEVIEND